MVAVNDPLHHRTFGGALPAGAGVSAAVARSVEFATGAGDSSSCRPVVKSDQITLVDGRKLRFYDCGEPCATYPVDADLAPRQRRARGDLPHALPVRVF
jgi:hypothetical protein